MKEIIKALLLTLTLTLLCGGAVLAEEQQYKVDPIGVSFEVPDGTLGYTRDSGISPDLMKVLYGNEDSESHEQKLLDEMKDNSEYYVGYDANNNYRISLRSKYTNTATLNTKSDEEILELVDAGFEGEFNQYGMTIDSKSVFTEDERKFAEVCLHDDTGYCCVYATVEDHQGYFYYIKVKATSNGVSDTYKSLIKQIAGSSEFFPPVEDSPKKSGNGATSNTSSQNNTDIFSLVIRVFEVVVILVVVVLALIFIVGLLTGNKGSGNSEISYGTRRDSNYMNRLSRVMQDDEQAKREQKMAEEAAKKRALIAELELEGMDEEQAKMEAEQLLTKTKEPTHSMPHTEQAQSTQVQDSSLDSTEDTMSEADKPADSAPAPKRHSFLADDDDMLS
ncbi:MAG: hypothetical protein K6G88_09595 [Lachnospiraceae bacterium]|nr:hypothetical protein [Lachnospiraceae bacterium]